MRAAFALSALALLGACSSSEGEDKAEKQSKDPIEARAKSIEKAADASVQIIEKDAQEQIDAAKAQDQVSVTPEE